MWSLYAMISGKPSALAAASEGLEDGGAEGWGDDAELVLDDGKLIFHSLSLSWSLFSLSFLFLFSLSLCLCLSLSHFLCLTLSLSLSLSLSFLSKKML